MVAQAALTGGVATAPSGARVVAAVVLADRPGLHVEQVGDTEQPAVQAEDLPVEQRPRKAGVELPDQPHPGLVGRPAVLVGEVEGFTRQGYADPAGLAGDVAAHPADRRELRRDRHLEVDDGLPHV
ncbi:MAG: hypothetical protein ACXWXO_17110 [Nocardioides sp.]